jgi:hypothetical protein
MNITYRKNITLESKCEDQESINNKRSKGHLIRIENYPLEDKGMNVMMTLPNGTKYYFDAESMLTMCEKILKLEKV